MVRPNALLDYLLNRLKLKTDSDLANYFDVLPPVMSKIRNMRREVSGNLILLIHEKTDMPVPQIRDLINQAEREYREDKKRTQSK